MSRPVRRWMAAWLGRAAIGVGNGAVREATYGKRLSEYAAFQLSVLTAIAAFGSYFFCLQRRWPPADRREAVRIGRIWLLLTVLFRLRTPGGQEIMVRPAGRLQPPPWAEMAAGPALALARAGDHPSPGRPQLTSRGAAEAGGPDAANGRSGHSGDGPGEAPAHARLSDQIEAWLQSDQDKTLRGLIAAFGDKSFAILFVLLLGVPALPLPTGGATHVMEIIAALLALELIAGRSEVWLPRRWRNLELAGARQRRFIASLMRLIRRLERISRPRLRFLFNRRSSNRVFGLLVLSGSAGAFFAPPFTGLDTLPALGVVLLALSVLLEDSLIALVAILVGVAGVILEITAGSLAIRGVGKLF